MYTLLLLLNSGAISVASILHIPGHIPIWAIPLILHTTNTILKSYVTIISVDLAATDPKNSIIYTYESENGEIINNINYQDKDAVKMYQKAGYFDKLGFYYGDYVIKSQVYAAAHMSFYPQAPSNNDLAEGKKVRITDGPFKNMVGKISSYDVEKKKVELLLDLFGQETSVEVELSEIENLK